MNEGKQYNPPEKLMNLSFVLLWQGQLVSQVGSQVAYVGTMLWVYAVTGSATIMGLLMMVSSIPGVLLGPIGGTFADRYSRKSIIVITDLLKGIAVCSFAALLFLVEGATDAKVAALFVLAVFNGIINAFFGPAVSASIPDLVPRRVLAGANSLMASSNQIATFIGQALGGILYRLFGAPLLFLIDGLSYLFSSGSETFIRLPRHAEKPKIQWSNILRIFKDETLEGFRYIWRSPGLRTTVFIAAFLNFFLAPFIVLMPVFVKDFLKAAEDWFGFILAGLGVGTLIGYIIAGTVRRTGRVRAATHVVFLIMFCLIFITLSAVRSAPLAVALMFASGLFLGIIQVDLQTVIQIGVPAEIRGRVFGFLGTLAGGLMPIAMGLSGVIADLLNGNVPIIYFGCGMLTVLISSLAALNREYRKFLATE